MDNKKELLFKELRDNLVYMKGLNSFSLRYERINYIKKEIKENAWVHITHDSGIVTIDWTKYPDIRHSYGETKDVTRHSLMWVEAFFNTKFEYALWGEDNSITSCFIGEKHAAIAKDVESQVKKIVDSYTKLTSLADEFEEWVKTNPKKQR